MSLFLGNLSSHTRRDDLDRVFQRFGQCNIRIKDGYGFVVYDFPPNAEKALRKLRGKDICGEPVTLAWSNKQPRLHQRFSRGSKPYEVQHGSFSRRGEVHASKKLGSNGRRGYKMANTQADSDGRRLNSVDILDEVSDHHAGEIRNRIIEDLPEEGKNVESNPLDEQRWGEQAGHLSNENGIGNGLEFDRYEPSHGYDWRDDDDNRLVIHSDGSPILQDPQEETGREQIDVVTLDRPDYIKQQGTCYLCGKSGHKMRDCPQEVATLRKKFSRFDSRRDDDISYRGRGKNELERIGFGSRRLQLRKSNISLRQDSNDRKPSGSGKHQKLKKTASSPTKNRTQSAHRMGYGLKKRSRRVDDSPKSHHAKKARGSVSSHIHSDYSASRSRSYSRSSHSDPGSSLRARSRSISSTKHNLSSNSRSSSASLFSQSGKYQFRSKSSSPASLSLAVSLSRPLPLSPNKVQTKLESSLDHAMSPKQILVEDGKQVTVDAVPDSSKLGNVFVAVNTGNAVPSVKPEHDVNEYHPWQRDVTGNHTMSSVKTEVKNLYQLPLDNGASTTGSLPPESLKETKEPRDPVAMVTELRSATNNQADTEAAISLSCSSSTSISPEEMYTVLKHYGLEQADEPERHLPVETYFGSARLWPWEIVYYRRLKKGPISTENYARRIAQNGEFGIFDKYIRSSSGWGELRQDES